MCTLDFCYCPTMKRVYLIQGKVINLSGANIVNRYTQSTRERLTNMITVLHHIAFSLLLRSFLTSVPSPTRDWYFSNQPSQTSFAVLSDVINDL
jgi:hypothetical protein